MKHLRTYSLLVLFVFTSVQAQLIDKEASLILDKTTQIIQKSSGTKVHFKLIIDNAQITEKETLEGVLFLKSDKYKYSLADIETYFDGKTQWVYMKKQKEVSVTEPTEEEVSEINPIFILTSYKEGYKITKEEDKKLDGITYYDINLYPENINEDIFRINLLIDKNTYHVSSIAISAKNGTTTTLKIEKQEKNLNFLDKMFVFDTSKHTDVEFIDLR